MLLNCPDCKHRISTAAKMCPNCGCQDSRLEAHIMKIENIYVGFRRMRFTIKCALKKGNYSEVKKHRELLKKRQLDRLRKKGIR